MTHRFPIKEIALQAGLGTATVDRVLNDRANVSPQTKIRVRTAIEELEAQEAQLAARGRRLFFDVVIEAPQRFSSEIRAAAEAVLPEIGTAVCRLRFVAQEVMQEAEVVSVLMRILKRGSHGVCLKARDTPKIRDAVNALQAAKIPVVTLVTDIAGTQRLSYVGLDNAGAGRTAAYLVARSIRDTHGTLLATRSHEQFLGEEAREIAFVSALAAACPQLRVMTVQGGSGVGYETSKVLSGVVNQLGHLRAVYSMGGGNSAILETLANRSLRPDIFIAHDFDKENRRLILERRLDFILHHDLTGDMKSAFNAFLCYHRIMAGPLDIPMSTVQILTPENTPSKAQ